jgi:hypothetical protein
MGDIDPMISLRNLEVQFVTDGLATSFIGTVNASSASGIYYYSSNVVFAMYNTVLTTNSVADLLGSVAIAFSQHILDPTQSFAPNAIVKTAGYIESFETILIVRWEWLGLPAIVLLSSAGFLVTTMLETRRSRIKIWKSSSLPLLYQSLDRLDDGSAVLENVSEMERDARRLEVRLVQLGPSNGRVRWKIVRGESSSESQE